MQSLLYIQHVSGGHQHTAQSLETDLHLLLVLRQHGDVVLLLLVLLLHDGPLALVQGDVLAWERRHASPTNQPGVSALCSCCEVVW